MRPHRRRFAVHRAVVAAATLVAALSSGSALAQPSDPPSDSSDARQRYEELGAQAASAEEDLSEAEEELELRQRQREEAISALAAATEATTKAHGAEADFRSQVDKFVSASFRGAKFNRLSAILTSGSQTEFLEQMSAIDVLATDNARSLAQLRDAASKATAARDRAAEAQRRAESATRAAERAVAAMRVRKAKLDDQIQQVRNALNQLSSSEREELSTVQDSGSYVGPPGAANDAMQAALSKRGSEYEWGAEGPDEFDCSGLTSWAYKQAGVSLPRTSRQQYGVGKPVSMDELQPGDLVFYDDGSGDPGAIHHVGMFVGDGKMVDAPTEGQVVDVRSIEGDGHYIGARRVVG